MNRREFLVSAGISGIGGLAGCSGLTEPDMEFQNFVVPDPRVVSLDTEDNEYFATIHNSGDSGNIRVELWHFQNSVAPNPSAPSIYQNSDHPGRHFDISRNRYYEPGERRKISITGSENPPTQSESREFGMIPWPASHGAVFKNTGASGDVEFRFEYRDSRGYNTEKPSNKLEAVGSDETIEVVFATVIPPKAEYEIVAEPV